MFLFKNCASAVYFIIFSEPVINFLLHYICQTPSLRLLCCEDWAERGEHARSSSAADAKFQLPEKGKRQQLFFDQTMWWWQSRNPEQDAASSSSPSPHLTTLFTPKSKKKLFKRVTWWSVCWASIKTEKCALKTPPLFEVKFINQAHIYVYLIDFLNWNFLTYFYSTDFYRL